MKLFIPDIFPYLLRFYWRHELKLHSPLTAVAPVFKIFTMLHMFFNVV